MAKGYSERRRSAVRVYNGQVLVTPQDNNTAVYLYGSQEKGCTDYTGVLRYTNEQARQLAHEILRLIGEEEKAPIVPGRAGTVDASDLHSLRMGDGEGKQTKVIDGGAVKMYVGMGWVELRKADQADTDLYPVVVREKG